MSSLPHPTLDFAGLYPRVSTDRQKDNWSVKDQLGLARLGRERGLRVVLYDGDLGISGETIEARPDMRRLLADLETGTISKPLDVQGQPTTGGVLRAIICVDLNRLSRDQDTIDGLRIKKVCKDAGATILTPGKTYDFANESDDLLAGLELLISGNQKQKIVKAVSRGLYQKAQAGGWVGGVVPYGYQLVRDVPHADGRPRGRLVIHPDEAAVVRLLYHLYTAGATRPDGTWHPLTLGGVARALNAAGHRLPIRMRRAWHARQVAAGEAPPGPRVFEVADVGRILENRLYAGYKVWGSGRAARRRDNPYVRDIGPAEVFDPTVRIVEPGVWLAAARQRQARATGPRRLAAVDRALLGLLRCPHCGGHMKARQERRAVVYECLNHRRSGTVEGRGCPQGGSFVTDHLAREAINAHLQQLFQQRDLDALLAGVEREAAQGDLVGQRRDVQAGLDEVQLALRNLVKAVARGDLSAADIREERQELDAKQARLETRLAGLADQDTPRAARLALAQALRGHTLEYVAHLGDRDPARYRQFLAWFFRRLVLQGTGWGQGRRVQVVGWDATPMGEDFLGAASWRLGQPLPGTPLDVAQKRNTQEWPWWQPLTLLVPAGAGPPPRPSAG